MICTDENLVSETLLGAGVKQEGDVQGNHKVALHSNRAAVIPPKTLGPTLQWDSWGSLMAT
jgi:hypothetical protein